MLVNIYLFARAADHQVYHKWAMLRQATDPTADCCGYLQCDISVNTKGEPIKIVESAPPSEDIDR